MSHALGSKKRGILRNGMGSPPPSEHLSTTWPGAMCAHPTRRVLVGGVREGYEKNAGRSTLSPAPLGIVHWTPSALGVYRTGGQGIATGAVVVFCVRFYEGWAFFQRLLMHGYAWGVNQAAQAASQPDAMHSFCSLLEGGHH
jgi:hypothetical protein